MELSAENMDSRLNNLALEGVRFHLSHYGAVLRAHRALLTSSEPSLRRQKLGLRECAAELGHQVMNHQDLAEIERGIRVPTVEQHAAIVAWLQRTAVVSDDSTQY